MVDAGGQNHAKTLSHQDLESLMEAIKWVNNFDVLLYLNLQCTNLGQLASYDA
jgi:hypothetical protein